MVSRHSLEFLRWQLAAVMRALWAPSWKNKAQSRLEERVGLFVPGGTQASAAPGMDAAGGG